MNSVTINSCPVNYQDWLKIFNQINQSGMTTALYDFCIKGQLVDKKHILNEFKTSLIDFLNIELNKCFKIFNKKIKLLLEVNDSKSVSVILSKLKITVSLYKFYNFLSFLDKEFLEQLNKSYDEQVKGFYDYLLKVISTNVIENDSNFDLYYQLKKYSMK